MSHVKRKSTGYALEEASFRPITVPRHMWPTVGALAQELDESQITIRQGPWKTILCSWSQNRRYDCQEPLELVFVIKSCG